MNNDLKKMIQIMEIVKNGKFKVGDLTPEHLMDISEDDVPPIMLDEFKRLKRRLKREQRPQKITKIFYD